MVATGVGAVPQMLTEDILGNADLPGGRDLPGNRDSSGLADSPGNLGIVVSAHGDEPTIIDELAAALAAALVRTWDRSAIAEHGRRFTWTAVAKETIGVYARVAAAGPASNS